MQLSGHSRGQKEGDKQHGQSPEENASDVKIEPLNVGVAN